MGVASTPLVRPRVIITISIENCTKNTSKIFVVLYSPRDGFGRALSVRYRKSLLNSKKEKKFFNVCALVTREIMRSKDAHCNTTE